MKPGEARDVDRAIADRLSELERERRRLDELTKAFRTVERSKFAQLQTFVATLGSLAGRGSVGRKILPPPQQNGHATNGANGASGAHLPMSNAAAAVTMRRLIDELTLANAARLDTMDALTVERSRRDYDEPYERWTRLYGTRDIDLERMREIVPFLPKRPLVSVIMATYDTPERYLRAALDSVRDQIYPDWELCIADDASPSPHVRRVLEEYKARDSRIKVVYRPENGHISKAGNTALAIATGEFVGYVDHDDLLAPEALFECVLLANRFPDVDMIYSDEDKIDDEGTTTDPFFKPDWNPDTFLSRMYTCHFGFYRRTLVEEIGGLRPEFDGSQDYDLVLRLTEKTSRIHHIPKVLYHWRLHAASTSFDMTAKPYAATAAERAIVEAMTRRGEPGTAKAVGDAGAYSIRYTIREKRKVSIIIPTRNHASDVDRCLGSIFSKSTYDDFEIVLVDNGSDDRSAIASFERWSERQPRVKVLRYDVPFNFSQINNYAASHCNGQYLLFLNNDTEVIANDWIEGMVEQAQRPSIGAVGALLLYPDQSIQHAGVIVGLGGVAGHSHKHFPADNPGYYYTLRSVNNVSAVTAACMMVRRNVFEQIGGFDEDFEVAFNDVDFCLRLLKAGYRNVYLPHVKLYHFESKSRGYETTPEKRARFDREIDKMRLRWDTETWNDPCYSPNLTRDYENFALKS